MDKITTFLDSRPVHILYLVTPAQTSSHLMAPSHKSSKLVTPRYTSSHLHTPLTIPHNFSRLRTCFKPISKQSTAHNRYEDIKKTNKTPTDCAMQLETCPRFLAGMQLYVCMYLGLEPGSRLKAARETLQPTKRDSSH